MRRAALALGIVLAWAATAGAAARASEYTNPADHTRVRVTALHVGQGNHFLRPRLGDVCLAAHVVIRNLGRTVNPGGSGVIEVETARGQAYWQSGACPVRTPYLARQPLAPGVTVAGWVTIELPRTSGRTYLGWTDGGRLNPPARLATIPLP